MQSNHKRRPQFVAPRYTTHTTVPNQQQLDEVIVIRSCSACGHDARDRSNLALPPSPLLLFLLSTNLCSKIKQLSALKRPNDQKLPLSIRNTKNAPNLYYLKHSKIVQRTTSNLGFTTQKKAQFVATERPGVISLPHSLRIEETPSPRTTSQIFPSPHLPLHRSSPPPGIGEKELQSTKLKTENTRNTSAGSRRRDGRGNRHAVDPVRQRSEQSHGVLPQQQTNIRSSGRKGRSGRERRLPVSFIH